MVAADVEGEGYLRIANFQDRWHMLGALEWMKASLLGFEFHQDED